MSKEEHTLTEESLYNLINAIEDKLNTKDYACQTIIKSVVQLQGKDIDCTQLLVIKSNTKVFINLDKDITVSAINLGNDSEVHIVGGYKIYCEGSLMSGVNSFVEPYDALEDAV